MITTTSFSPLTSNTTSTSSVTLSGSPRESAAITSANGGAVAADKPSAVFIRSERYQALENAQPAAPASSVGAAKTVSNPDAVGPLPGAEERSQQTAANILGFMTLQLQRDVQDGASAEQLSSRVLAGLDGFKQGFTEAAQQLSDMGLMTEELKAELQLTYDRVIAGAAELHQQFVGTDLELDAGDVGPWASLAAGAAATTQQNSPALQASLDDFSNYVVEQLLGQRQGVDSLLAYLESLQVETEPVMVSQLLEKVAELAESYTSGGVQAAYEEAVELGYTDQEIGLYVQQSGQPSVQRAQQAYGSVQFQESTREVAGRWQPLINFAQELRDVQDTASRLPQPEDVLVRMTEVFNTSGDSGFPRVTAALLSTQRDTA